MSISRKTRLSVSSLGAIVFLAVGYRAFFGHHEPLGESPGIQFSPTLKSREEIGQFLSSGNFVIIDRIENLPKSVSIVYKEANGTRLTMANPGRKFNATDVIDASIPMKRLIFAGVAGDKCFVHYEHGGRIAYSYELELFKLLSANDLEPIWKGHCGRAKDLNDLKDQLERGDCQSQ